MSDPATSPEALAEARALFGRTRSLLADGEIEALAWRIACRLDELRADRDRLDWLERTRGVDCRHHDNDERHGFTLREAIDAACSTTGGEDGDGKE